MKSVSERKVTRARVDTSQTSAPVADRVRVTRVAGPAGRAVRWRVSRPETTKK